MTRILVAIFLSVIPVLALSQDRSDIVRAVVEGDILSGYAELEAQTARLASAAQNACDSEETRQRFKDAFLAWTTVSHLRFGPSEEDNRAFALAFWPDPRGKTPKALRMLLADADPETLKPEVFKEQSIAARGFYALEFLLYDTNIRTSGPKDYHCALVQAVSRDIHATSQDLVTAWHSYAPVLLKPGPDTPYRTDQEVVQVLYKSAATGLEFTMDTRFGRPLGTFDKPRPRRAEAWRSGLSKDLIAGAVEASGLLALRLSSADEKLTERLDDAVRYFLDAVVEIDDPALAGVATPQGRIRIESLTTKLSDIQAIVNQDLGVHLGAISGFNALDGD